MRRTYDISKIQQISAVKLRPRPFKANHGPVLARSLWAIQLHGEVHQSFTKSSNSPIFPHVCFTKTHIYNDLQVSIIYIYIYIYIHISYIYTYIYIYIIYLWYLHTSTPASSETFSARKNKKHRRVSAELGTKAPVERQTYRGGAGGSWTKTAGIQACHRRDQRKSWENLGKKTWKNYKIHWFSDQIYHSLCKVTILCYSWVAHVHTLDCHHMAYGGAKHAMGRLLLELFWFLCNDWFNLSVPCTFSLSQPASHCRGIEVGEKGIDLYRLI